MPPKRPGRGAATAAGERGNGEKPKKRRVSLACDACRAAREKCDGARPECGTCLSQHRACSYTPATKKRGVQTGYLRTIELSLAWLFDQVPECEESLHRFLVNGDGDSTKDASKDNRALLGKGSAGHHLQRMWNKSRVRRAVDGLLSDTQGINSENSGNDSETDVERQTITRDATSRGAGTPLALTGTTQEGHGLDGRIIKLPGNWRRLLDVYASYTHCWLPIMNLDALGSIASSYPPQGIRLRSNELYSNYSSHAELWAAMAIASYQDIDNTDSSNPTSLSVARIFEVSRSMIPPDDGTFDIHSINAIIIHAVILIGKGRIVAASLLLGKSMRLLRQLPSTKELSHDDGDFSGIQQEVVSLACSFLDVLTSLFLQQHPMGAFGATRGPYRASVVEYAAFDKPWDPLPRKPTSATAAIPQQMSHPIRTLIQLHAFASVLSDFLASQMQGETHLGTPSPEDLVRTLDGRFNFCNSLISSGSTPTVPSAYLVKLLFFTATIELASDLRSSLLSGFLEIVDACFEKFGANYIPPVVVLLLQLVQRRAKVDGMGESDQRKWLSITEKMRHIWPERDESTNALYTVPANSGVPTRPEDVQQITFTPITTDAHPHVENQIRARSQPVGFGLSPLPGSKSAEQFRFGYQDAIPNPAFTIDTPLTTHPNTGRANTHNIFPGNHRMSQNFDYDAIFEDLGSIGYTDNLEMDTRFMTNLGFAPGCDLAEIFQGDFGV